MSLWLRQEIQTLSRCVAGQWLSLEESALSAGFIHVVAAVLLDAQQRVLIAQRPRGKHLAGGWEFPGGKLEPDEDRLAGLTRELREELGVQLQAAQPLVQLRHEYVDRKILLDVWLVSRFRGEPQSLDGQALRWCSVQELPAARLLEADKPVIDALTTVLAARKGLPADRDVDPQIR